MGPSYFYLNFLRGLTRQLMRRNYSYALVYIFVQYTCLRLKRALEMTFTWQTLPDNIFNNMAQRCGDQHNEYVDWNSCVLGNVNYYKISSPTWFYICSKVSLKKYKVLFIPFGDVGINKVSFSQTMRYNVENALQCGLDNCFLLPVQHNIINFATEVGISLISNPHESSNQLTDALLENYFAVPRFVRKNDIFCIDVKEHVPDQFYSSGNLLKFPIYFKITDVKVNNDNSNVGSYIVRGKTTLVQEPNVHSYLPRKYSCHNQTKEPLANEYPPNFSESLDRLERCILPFVKHGIRLLLKPMFLVKGSPGSGKCNLIRITAEKMGLNFLNIDFAEVQALTSAQTEAKLRIVLQNAKQSVPCILCLKNIEIFGKNSEGQKDERIMSAFSTEVNALYDNNFKYPLIIVATTSESDIPAELQRMFIETIKINHLDQSTRMKLISWQLENRKLHHVADLSKIAGTCSDFGFSDLDALMLHAVKARCKRIRENSESISLTQEDFDKAYEYMQSIYTDCNGAPRVPKVYWEDIGGLADLKHEIMRRIQLPLLNALGFGQSGLLLYGPPGTGKTLLAKAVATEYQLHFMSIKGPEVLNMYVGQSEKNVRQVFERARAAAPCIIFFDELDSLAPNRGRSGDSGGVMDRVVSQLLAEMDGLENSSNIFIIGATNRPDLIDPALLRPGRFDKMLYVGIHSDRLSQLNVLQALTRKFKLRENGRELEELVDRLPSHTTGADLYAVCSDAWLNAARNVLSNDQGTLSDQSTFKENTSISVGFEDFLKAATELVPSVGEEEAERYRRMQRELSSVS